MSVVTSPGRYYAQQIAALGKANDTRSLRADLKRDLKAGRVQVRDVLESPPDWLARMSLSDLLVAVPRIGPDAVRKLLRMADISPMKTVGGLSERQRGALVSLLGVGRSPKEERNEVCS